MIEDKIIGIGIPVVLVALVAALIYGSIQDNKRWQAFKIAHQCKIVAHITGDVFNTYSTDAKGNMVVGVGSTPDKTGWACDDGITYYR